MTSLPPNFSSDPSAGLAGVENADAGIQALLETISGPAGRTDASPATAATFAVLLNNPSAPPANGAARPLGATPAAPRILVSFAGVPAVPAAIDTMLDAPDGLLAPVDGTDPAAVPAAAPAADIFVTVADSDAEPMPGDEVIGQIAAVIASLLQALPRETVAPAPVESAPLSAEAGVPAADRHFGPAAPVRVTVQIAGAQPFEVSLPAGLVPASSGHPVAPATPAARPIDTPVGETETPPSPSALLAALRQEIPAAIAAARPPVETGAIPQAAAVALAPAPADEPPPRPDAARAQLLPDVAAIAAEAPVGRTQALMPKSVTALPARAEQAEPAAADAPATVEFETADGVAVTIAVAIEPKSPAVARVAVDAAAAPRRAVNIAASAGPDGREKDGAEPAGEKTFLSSADKEVKSFQETAGIGVAQPRDNMPSAAFEQHRALQKPELPPVAPARLDLLPVHAKTPEVAPAPEPAPAPQPSGESFAHRAVQTVVGLAEAQFAATLNRSGSVNLRLKFAGEDLTVRVELRDGAVHTDFRTDSAQLRGVLQQEWQAVAAASPEQKLRYLEPVFGPAAGSGGTASPHDQSPRQQPQPQAHESFLPGNTFAVRPARRTANGPVDHADAASRARLAPPTALRLSALA